MFKYTIVFLFLALSFEVDAQTKSEEGKRVLDKGQEYFSLGETEKAIESFRSALDLFSTANDTSWYARSMHWLATCYENQGNITLALEYYDRCIKIQGIAGDSLGKGYTLISAGYNNVELGNYEGGEKLLQESLEIFESLNHEHGIANALANLAFVKSEQGNYKEALDIHRSILNINSEDTVGTAYTNKNIGEMFLELDEFDSAEVYLKESLKLFEGSSFEFYGRSIVLNLLAKLYNSQSEFSTAEDYASQALEISVSSNFVAGNRDASLILSKIYEGQGQKDRAYDFYKNYILLNDSLKNEESQKTAIQNEFRYQYEKQKVEDALEHQNALNIEKSKKEKQQIVSVFAIVGILIVGVLLFVIYKRLVYTRKQNVIIENQKEEIEHQHGEIQDSIAYAKRIQQAILPPEKLFNECFNEAFVLYKPKDVVAGDFYWLETKEGTIYFAAADCTGHGVPGAMVSVICNGGLNRSVHEFDLSQPGDILNKTRELVIKEFEKSEDEVKDGMDIALCSLSGNELNYSGAHNPLWVIRKDGSELEEIKADKQPIGSYSEQKPFSTHQLRMNAGDTVYVFSDGFADQFGGEKGKKYKAKNFKRLLLSIQNETMERQKELIDKAFEDWRGSLEQLDDVCVIGVRV